MTVIDFNPLLLIAFIWLVALPILEWAERQAGMEDDRE